jgi:hypothetical protein
MRMMSLSFGMGHTEKEKRNGGMILLAFIKRPTMILLRSLVHSGMDI